MSPIPLSRALMCLLLCLLQSTLLAQTLLDRSFGDAGLRALNALGGFVEAMGSCPHADGSISVVGYRAVNGTLVIARLTAAGELDTRFSEDGVSEVSIFMPMAAERSATSCSGVGNSTPEDDRVLVAASSPGSTYDTVVAALLDLNTGLLDTGFYSGGIAIWDIGGLIVPPVNGVRAYPQTHVRGVFSGPSGGWLLVGQLAGHSSGIPRGMIARVNAIGSLDAYAAPNPSGFDPLELNAARVGNDGHLRVLGSGVTTTGVSWGLLSLDPLTLAPTLLQTGSGDFFDFRIFKGRAIGGGLMVAAALKNDGSAFGSSPKMLIVRDSAVTELALPAVPSLEGVAAGPSGLSGSAAATGAVNNRAVFGMGLQTPNNALAGYYVSVVKLGNGAGVPDQVDVSFGQQGAASFRYRPTTSVCAPEQAPPQRFANLSSWGETTLMVGSTVPDCGPAFESSILAVRLNTDGEHLHHNGFE
ncbi:MAG: hypothetical protein AB7E72_19550 [Lysobacterales bacterium]